MSVKYILLAVALILVVTSSVFYSPELAIRMNLFLNRDFTSAFTAVVKEACCSDSNGNPAYMIELNQAVSVFTLEKSFLGTWRVPKNIL